MTETQYKRLRDLATTYEATNLDGNVTVDQRFLRILMHAIDETKAMTHDEYTARVERVTKDGFDPR